jgi:long-chain acyl-CoA synthetase
MAGMTNAAMSTGEEGVQAWLAANRRRAPDKLLIESIDQGKSISHGGMHRLTRRIAAELEARGLRANDRVVLLAGNSLEHLAVYFGVLAYGATICTVNVDMNRAHLATILKALDARLVLFEEDADLDKGLIGAGGGEWLALGAWRGEGGGSGFFARIAGHSGERDIAPVNRPEDIAAIFYTSGTEAMPKGIILPHGDLVACAKATAEAFGIAAEDRILDFRSFGWVSAQVLSALAPLYRGATLLLARKFSRSRYFDWLRDHRATIGAGNPTTINMLNTHPEAVTGEDLPGLRYIFSSSAPLLAKDWTAFEARYHIPIVQGFGASEINWIAGTDERGVRFGSVGCSLRHQTLRIVDVAGNALPPGETGEVEVERAPDAEYRYLRADGRIETHARGRIRTGDLGYLDADGYLFLTGRGKEIIIRGGVNISPVEIDTCVRELAGVAEAATIGVPDDIHGEAVVVIAVAAPGAALTPEDILAHCRAHLAPAKQPREVVLRAGLPKTARGKIDRRALAEDWRRQN